MGNRYKITLSNHNFYKEIELSPETTQVKVGTSVECDIRLHKELFFEKIELLFVKSENEWSVHCSDNLYLTVGDIRKLVTKKLTHGDSLEIKYQESDNTVFSMDFLIDFDDGKTKYERVIDVSGVNRFTIGTSSAFNIVLGGNFVKQDAMELIKKNDGYVVDIKQTTYGVYINGKKAKTGELVSNGDFLSVSDYFFYIKDGKIWTQIRSDMNVNNLNYSDNKLKNSYPKFNRNTRVKTVVCDEKIEILDPPAKPQKPKSNIFSRLLPSLLAIGVGIVMAVAMKSPYMLFTSGIGIVTAIISIVQGDKDFKQNSEERITKYNAYIQNKKQEITQCREKEKAELEELFVSQPIEQERLKEFSSDLFDRSKDDEDYLCVRLGSGDVVSKREVNYKKQEKLEIEDELQQLPQQVCDEYKNVHNAPIVCDFKEINAMGVVGAPSFRFEFLKNIVIDIAARQYFSDVKMFFVAEKENKEQIQWLRFLPHVYNEEIGIRNIVCDDESKNIIFEYLYKELTAREQNKSFEENLVVFFYDEYGFKSHPISKFVDKAKDLGVTFIFFGDEISNISQGCSYIVSINDDQNAALINTQNKSEDSNFVYPVIETDKAKKIVEFLAPVYTEEISLEGTLTKNITMFELLNILAVDDIDLNSRWKNSKVFKSMAAPLGVSKTGVVSLDLHDKAHGPHGLVAGTTGSGKSEILQTYVLAMSTLFHPYEVSFVIIDFKGGGMVNQFKELPHLLGAITNIDGKEIDRSLKSIKAELQKRQRLFAEADVNHIDKYIKKYKMGEVDTPLPHLIIIVDEFAELKAEQPEFMKELISAARIGRSLGVHLILATQKPSGQVNEQIWSNSRFKLCLKVQSQEDSNEVLKSPLAAEIKEPGRAYLQVGNNEIFELFQSAYSGASEKADDSNVKEFNIYNLTESGKRVPVYSQKKKKSGEGSATQLDAIVKYVADYCEEKRIQKLPDICLPSLKSVIEYNAALEDDFAVPIGIYDDPDNQVQDVFGVNIFNENTLVIGSAMTGKTNLLQLIIRGIANKYTPQEVNMYIIDFASMVLKNFEGLNHVGGVVVSNEDEKLKNLFKLLNEEIATRKEKLLAAGVSSFLAYKEAGNTDLAQIVLLIDNLTALNELYLQDDDFLINLTREGLAVGISVVVANSQTAGIGYKYMSNFSSKIALFCNDSSEYSTVFDYCRMSLDAIPGRCIIQNNKQHFECQTYLAFDGEKEFERVEKIKEFVDDANTRNTNSKARIIPVIPELLNIKFAQQLSYSATNRFEFVVGLNYSNVSPVVFNLAKMGMFAITGRPSAGRSNFIHYMISAMQTKAEDSVEVHVVDNIERRLSDIQENSVVKSYSIMPENAIEAILNAEKELENRYNILMSGDESIIEKSKLILLVINNYDAIEAISNNSEALKAYKNIVGRYKNLKVCVVFGDYENTNISYSAPELVKSIRDTKHFVYFDDIDSMKIIDFPLAVMRKYKKPISVGDGYYINDNECIRIKTVLNK